MSVLSQAIPSLTDICLVGQISAAAPVAHYSRLLIILVGLGVLGLLGIVVLIAVVAVVSKKKS
ncbi:MAG: hypothetical protein COA78_01795 [Blastopirellula sp.]|nr:MAG: hypothetical protein COA78_01795 [Blastopirellula sp.]